MFCSPIFFLRLLKKIMGGLELIMWLQGQWEALKKKSAPDGMNTHTDRQTDGHGDAMTESAQWSWFTEKWCAIFFTKTLWAPLTLVWYKRNCFKAGFVSILVFDWTYHLCHCSVTKHNWSVSTNTWPTNCASYFMAELLSVAEFIGRVFGCANKFAITDMISTNCHIVKLALLLIIQFFDRPGVAGAVLQTAS